MIQGLQETFRSLDAQRVNWLRVVRSLSSSSYLLPFLHRQHGVLGRNLTTPLPYRCIIDQVTNASVAENLMTDRML